MYVQLFTVKMKKRTVCDRQNWTERYSGGKYQEARIRMKARKELEEWDEKVQK